VLAGAEAGAEGLLETSVPRVYAAGEVLSGSTKRCATAVGEGATVVRSCTRASRRSAPRGRRQAGTASRQAFAARSPERTAPSMWMWPTPAMSVHAQ
jgi:hypothetical protein